MQLISLIILGAGVGFCFLIALSILVVKSRFLAKYFIAGTMASAALAFIAPLVHVANLQNSNMATLASVLFLYFIGPLFYLYHQSLFGTELSKANLYHLIPIVLVSILLLLFRNTGSDPFLFQLDFSALLSLLGLLHLLIYIVITLKGIEQTFREVGEHQSRSAVLTILCLGIGYGIGVLLMGLGWLSYHSLTHGGAIFLVFVILAHFLFLQRHPETAFLISLNPPEAQRDHLVDNLDRETIRQRLSRLMDNEEIYLSCDLTLTSLAKKLLITPQQLSAYINVVEGENYNTYINRKRISRAKSILLQDQAKSILTIAYEVGFNSKSTFNSAFLKFTHLTPSQFRKQQGSS